MKDLILVNVWEVYERDSQRCVMFKSESHARNQSFFDDVDIIAEAKVYMTAEELDRLNNGEMVHS